MTDNAAEAWVALNLEAALVGVVVKAYDDGSLDGMHDLDLVQDGRVFGGCEVTAAADAAPIEFWNVANGRRQDRWTERDLVGGWSIAARPTARVNKLRTTLPMILRDLERCGTTEVDVESGLGTHASRLSSLGVVVARQNRTDFPGSIYLTVDLPSERRGGAVPDSGDDLASWVGGWLAHPAQRHNIDKLLRADRDERHVFILFPGFTTAPFVVADVLMRPNVTLASQRSASPYEHQPPLADEYLGHRRLVTTTTCSTGLEPIGFGTRNLHPPRWA